MNKIHELIYDKCMRLAKEYMNLYVKEHGKKLNFGKRSYKIHNPWVDLYSEFDKGKIGEEDVKYCFNLGYVPEQYFCDNSSVGELPRNNLINKKYVIYRYS